MKAAVVTGATGFVGRWLVRELLDRDIEVTAVIRPDSKRLDMLPKHSKLFIVPCGMEEYAVLPGLLGKQDHCTFFHLAWEGVYGPKRIDLETQLRCIAASKAAVEAAAALKCVGFVGLGSIMEKEAVAVTDADGSKPGLGYIYGEAKHTAHLVTKAVAADMGLPHFWPILTNAYGERDDSTRFINATLHKILSNEPLEFTSGTQIYDFIHVQDVADALIVIAEKGKPYHSYMIGSGKAAPLRSFVESIGKTLAPERALHYGNVPYTGVQLPESAFSTKSLYEDTGFVPAIPFDEGIRRTMTWLKETEET